MKHYQSEKNSMYQKMLLFFANPVNIAVWVTFTRLVDEIANFVSLNAILSNYIQQHHADIKGFTTSKNNAFITMIKLVVKKSQKAYVWAVDSANDKLAQVFDVQVSDFTKISENKAYTMIKNIRDALATNIDAMGSVQLTADDITAINAAITAYENTIGTPAAAKSHKTEGTMALDSLFRPIDKSLGLIDNLMDSEYSESNIDMVKEYWVNRNIDKLPTHHSGVYAVITDALTGDALKGAVLAVNGKTATSDMDGMAEISKNKPGTYMAKVTLANYTIQDVKIVIERGRVTEIEVKMEK